MRVFVTGATGFIGSHLVPELIANGHQVLGMARSEEGARALKARGAQVLRGSLEDTNSLKEGATNTDAVIHLAFIHDFSRFQENCAIDKRAIEALGSVLAGSNRPLIVTAGTAGNTAPGEMSTEDRDIPKDSPFPRVSEQTALSLQGVSAAVMRLPQVHDTFKQGLVSYAIAIAREKGVSAYIGAGRNRWPAVHILDAARCYRLALEKHEKGARYHAVGEEGVTMRDISEVIGRKLEVPTRSINADQAGAHFGWLGMFASFDCPASSAITQKKLGWRPTGPAMLADLEKMDFTAA
jgi:nucleoside-diphosphate-sugar epimerase